ncbi:MAG: response regulator [Chitinophagaceae bacterium]|nr:response regulator [Anaerolineae bacterium]
MSIKHDPPLVLIADDQIPTTVMLERVFEYEGYQVKSVYDGLAAVEAAHTLLPDLILLDVNMPGITGFEVLRQLREHPNTSNIPTILITAMGELSDIVQGLNLGADDYLKKPFHAQELLVRAQSKMKSRKLEDSLLRRRQELEALLRVSEELNQHLEVDDLLGFILYLTLDLLPGEAAAIYQINKEGDIVDYAVKRKDGTSSENMFDDAVILQYFRNNNQVVLWPDAAPVFPEFNSGMIAPLQYGGSTHGLLMLVNNQPYDEDQLRLFNGISKQATLALRNAELYAIQANYAMHLEDMVAERTSALQSAQQMLIRAEKLASVGRLAASIAHEINNPLMPIQINLEHMMEDIHSGHPIDSEDIERAQESVARIHRIVNRLLEFTGKRQSGSSDLQSLDVNKLIDSITGLIRKSFEQSNMKIVCNLAPLPQIYGNKDQLEQVLMNLALNAKAAMKKGGILEINTTNQANEVVIEVKDTGHGIPADIIENIFEPFVSTKDEGTGLGLFISYGIVQNHSGTIQVQSEVGKGTNFILRLPVSNTN